jgi:hypothetical protein
MGLVTIKIVVVSATRANTSIVNIFHIIRVKRLVAILAIGKITD